MSFLYGIFAGFVATFLLELLLQKNKRLRHEFWEHHKPVFGYHLHHSFIGLLFIIFAIFLWFLHPLSLFVAGFGLGIIIMHTYTAKEFVFIEKSNKERKN